MFFKVGSELPPILGVVFIFSDYLKMTIQIPSKIPRLKTCCCLDVGKGVLYSSYALCILWIIYAIVALIGSIGS